MDSRRHRIPTLSVCVAVGALLMHIGLASGLVAQERQDHRWKHDPRAQGKHFPIGVWLQSPKYAARYKAAGFNLYVGLWKGPTEEQLAALRKAGMPVICSQNAVGLKNRADPIIRAWMHGDEPDNAQSRGKGKGYGPPILPARIVESYRRLKEADPSRPILLNLGQGVAWDHWRGRGTRTNHPEDYPEYVKGCDIASFDIYPVVHRNSEVAGKITFVARGIDRLRKWTGDRKHVWNCIECTRISNTEVKPTPAQVRAEVWLSIIHGSRGIIYFVHQFKPRFNERALLADAAMLATVSSVNARIHRLAEVINSEQEKGVVANAPIHAAARRHGGATYIFAVNTSGETTTAKISIKGIGRAQRLEVLDEKRAVKAGGGTIKDSFDPWGVHIYRIR